MNGQDLMKSRSFLVVDRKKYHNNFHSLGLDIDKNCEWKFGLRIITNRICY